MAGICRPDSNIYECGEEMTEYKLIGGIGSQGAQPKGLINGIIKNEWNTENVMYWLTNIHYVTFKFNKPCYIWRSGVNGWSHYVGTLKITNLDTGKVVTDEVTIANVTRLQCNEWEKVYYIKEPGTYEFRLLQNYNYRMDSEWFFEKASNESEIIKNKIKNTILNNELFQKYCIPYEEK